MRFFRLLLLLAMLSLVGCKSIPKKAWTNPTQKEIVLDLQAGDIVLKEKEFNLLGMFGHVGIMKDERTVVDYPKFGANVILTDIGYWLEMNRKFMILRYKKMNEEFRFKLLMNLNYYIYLDKPYRITFNKNREDGFYCSQFIWYIYHKTAKDLGFDLNLTPKAGAIVFPYDFLYSNQLFLVK